MEKRKIPLQTLASAVGGTLIGDPSLEIEQIRPLLEAKSGDLSFFAPNNKKGAGELLEAARNTKATALLVAQTETDLPLPCAKIVVQNPMAAVIQLSLQFFDNTPKLPPGIHPTAVVAETARIGKNVAIGAYVVISDNVTIGDNSVLHPHVVIYPDASLGADCVLHAGAIIRERTILGDDCLIQNGAVIGSDGFGYIPDRVVGHRRVPHSGNVHLGNRVDVGTNAAIDRATLGTSTLGDATKVDNLVQIGHNANIGQRVLLCGQTGVSGSCTIGDDVILGGGVGVRDHATIAPKVRASARSGITGDILEQQDVAGYPHSEVHAWRREHAALRRLPELISQVRVMKRELAELKELLAGRHNFAEEAKAGKQ